MKLRLPILATTLAVMAMFLVVPTASAASPTAARAAAPVNTTTTSGGTFTGTVSNLVFSNVNGVLNVAGTLTGTLTNGGTVSNLLNVPFSTTATATGTCQILTLSIGAIHLNLAGLVVDLNPILLNITAQSGPGNLLGNLLCAVAHLLDSNGVSGALAGLLNNIVTQLGL